MQTLCLDLQTLGGENRILVPMLPFNNSRMWTNQQTLWKKVNRDLALVKGSDRDMLGLHIIQQKKTVTLCMDDQTQDTRIA